MKLEITRTIARSLLLGAFFSAAVVTHNSYAATPLNGLTVAVSQSGDKLVAGGSTRTILVLDPNSLEVKSRHWIGVSIVRMAFNKDASILAVQGTSRIVYLYDTNTWKTKYQLQRHDLMTTNVAKDILAAVNHSYRDGVIFLKSMKDGSSIGQIPLEEKQRVSALGFNREGTRLGVLYRGKKSQNEKKLAYRDIPRDLRGLAREDFKQRNDGRESIYRVYSVPDGKLITEKDTFFTLNNGLLSVDRSGLTVLGYSTDGARINQDGNANLFRTKNSFNYGVALSPNQDLWLSGGLRNYSITANPSLTAKGNGRLDRLPSWPEYFKGFASTADNKWIYAGTSAYRVVKIDGGTGKLVKVVPVK